MRGVRSYRSGLAPWGYGIVVTGVNYHRIFVPTGTGFRRDGLAPTVGSFLHRGIVPTGTGLRRNGLAPTGAGLRHGGITQLKVKTIEVPRISGLLKNKT